MKGETDETKSLEEREGGEEDKESTGIVGMLNWRVGD
jgi:hypothetical protein